MGAGGWVEVGGGGAGGEERLLTLDNKRETERERERLREREKFIDNQIDDFSDTRQPGLDVGS
jgi:hypothetical protein